MTNPVCQDPIDRRGGWADGNLSYYSKNTKLNVMEGYFLYITYRFKDDPILAQLAKTAAYIGA